MVQARQEEKVRDDPAGGAVRRRRAPRGRDRRGTQRHRGDEGSRRTGRGSRGERVARPGGRGRGCRRGRRTGTRTQDADGDADADADEDEPGARMRTRTRTRLRLTGRARSGWTRLKPQSRTGRARTSRLGRREGPRSPPCRILGRRCGRSGTDYVRNGRTDWARHDSRTARARHRDRPVWAGAGARARWASHRGWTHREQTGRSWTGGLRWTGRCLAGRCSRHYPWSQGWRRRAGSGAGSPGGRCCRPA